MATQTNKRPNLTNTRSSVGKPPAAPAPSPISPSSLSAVSARDGGVQGLVDVLYHALQGVDTYAKYLEEARRGSDNELVQVFRDAKAEGEERVARAKRLLAVRLEDYAVDGEDSEEDEEEEEDDEDEEEEDEDD